MLESLKENSQRFKIPLSNLLALEWLFFVDVLFCFVWYSALFFFANDYF